jgi:hypothetical protein
MPSDKNFIKRLFCLKSVHANLSHKSDTVFHCDGMGWFDDECSKLIDRRKQAKLQWLQNPSQVNGDNMDTKT